MSKTFIPFSDIANEMERIYLLRERYTDEAFRTLEYQFSTLAQYLLHETGDRRRAAAWMAKHQRAFGGRTAYQVLAEGDQDSVWDEVERVGPNEHAPLISYQ